MNRHCKLGPPKAAALWLLSGTALCWAAPANQPADCRAMAKHGHRTEAQDCYEALVKSNSAYLRAEGYWGLEQYAQANEEFRIATTPTDSPALYRVRWGMLLHERFNNSEAEDLFTEALVQDPKNAQAYVGLAQVSADGFDAHAAEYAGKAIELDPKLVEAHELMASIALENDDTKQAIEQADQALAIAPDALDAMAIHAAVELNADHSPDAWLAKIAQVNAGYGQGYAIIAHDLEMHYRYEDAIAYYRKAVEADPHLWSAHSQLGINLMRMGKEDEPRQQLQLAL